MLFTIINVLFGILFTLFIPGFILTKLLFKDLKYLEQFLLSIVFSLIISISLGLFLGANETMANITGGITEFNLWFYMILLTIILSGAYFIKKSTSEN